MWLWGVGKALKGALGLKERTHVPYLERWVGKGLGESASMWEGAPKGGHVRVLGDGS
jgi:hypothetical protein